MNTPTTPQAQKIAQKLGITPSTTPPARRTLLEEFGRDGLAHLLREYRHLKRLGREQEFEFD